MLSKLYKHEFKSLFRTLWPAYAGLIALAILSRLSLLFRDSGAASQDNDALARILNTINGAIITFYGLGIFAIFIISFVIVVIRFYKHLLSGQGYLSFTLPVSPTNHILCKLVCGTVMMILSFIGVVLSLTILSIGYDFLPAFFRGLCLLWNEMWKTGNGSAIISILLGVIFAVILSAVNSLTLIYASISIGQTFKNRISAAVLVFIGMTMALQFISAIIFLPVIIGNVDAFNNAIQSLNFFSTTLIIANCATLAVSAGLFFVTRHMLTKKLNLE